MAKSSSYGLGLACFAIAAAVAGATQYTVGGANGWCVPSAGAEPMNTWAERTRFQIGDSLLFVYPKDQDSVLLVEPADYNACNTSSYVRKFDDGDTVVTLDRSGPLFFISGVEAHCRANEKLIVMVLASRSNGTGTGGGGAQVPSTAPPPASPASPPPPASSSPPPSSSSPAPPKAPTPALPPAPAPPAGSTSAPPPASARPSTPPSAPSSPPAPSASSPPPASATPPPPPAAAGAPQTPPAPSASSPAPSAHGATTNSTGTPSSPPAGASKDKNGAALTVATGLATSFGACILGYSMLAL